MPGSVNILRYLHRSLLLFLCLCSVSGADVRGSFALPDSLLNSVEKQYGIRAKDRLLAWQVLIRTDSSKTDIEKLKKVNDFFNKIRFVDDAILWKKKDYWATPVEFLSTNGGDCEDFSLAKYFTLKALGVHESKLNMTYVKALELNQAHMVVTYYATPQAEPLVLDNLIKDIRPASKRRDLLPVYSFNGSGLWLAKVRGKGQRVGDSDRLKLWQDLLKRMPEGLN
jgi:predicted transglutaminase-like cysteine proteinase